MARLQDKCDSVHKTRVNCVVLCCICDTENMSFQVCLVYNAGELNLIEYGQNNILGMARTEYMSPYLISVCISPARGSLAAEKKMAYLIDKQTAKVSDLLAGVVLATVSHTSKIDWLVRRIVFLTMSP